MNKTFLFVLCTVIISYVETREVSKKIKFVWESTKINFLTFFLIFQVRSAPRLVSDESILPHTPDLWKRGLLLLALHFLLHVTASLFSGLCERVARQTSLSKDGPPECQPVGSKVDCG